MPNRILKEAICTSAKIARLEYHHEVLFYRLIVVADDFGRMDARPAIVRARCFPLREEITSKQIGDWLMQLAEFDLIQFYADEHGQYLYIKQWDNHQRLRNTKAKYPPPPEPTPHPSDEDKQGLPQPAASCRGSPQAAARAGAETEFEVESETEPEKGGCPTRRLHPRDPPDAKGLKTPIPANFGVSEEVQAWAQQHGYDRLDEHLEAFRRKCKAKGYEYVDWDSALMMAIAQNWAQLEPKGPSLCDLLDQEEARRMAEMANEGNDHG
jgi:hypothetical protein